ncbi:hypothetical protein GCM10010377_52110 [Streptomyces viridiviolaceus]|uniref:Cytochrome C oxidase subunit I n=1 Tax=Streptomyces viridiviolaceus TaxID=68282 RepID=A0ABW2E843_9ACTN|nr:hypothetical protein [Streptomyces viridiviolaceus]GHB54572.1 hypothetical protein GCM10010377_52110 [Streptomyces viridiviolaceus]
MSHGAPDASHGDGHRTLADDVEGYLLARAHHDQARREAEDLCARMPWLTTAQAEDVTRHYIRHRIDLTRQMLLDTVQRATQLRQEYENRYATLRRSLLTMHAAGACAVLACAAGLSALACLLPR